MSSKNIRVYELAKELNKTSKEIIAVLAEKNIEVTTHMATLEDNQAAMVRAQVNKTLKAKEEPQAPKQEQPQTQEQKPVQKKKKFIVVHNPENSRDKKSPERRVLPRKPKEERPQQPKKEQAAKPEVKAPEVKNEPKTEQPKQEVKTENRNKAPETVTVRKEERPQNNRQENQIGRASCRERVSS